MGINLKLEDYKEWLQKNSDLTDPFSEGALRQLTYHILLGRNYRLLTEPNTQGKLFTTFLWLSDIQKDAIDKHGSNWIEALFDEIYSKDRKPKELKNLLFWIMGTTVKGAQNLGFKKENYPELLSTTIKFFNDLFHDLGREDFRDQAWLLFMAGSATLNIRGSQKSKVGKQFERVLTRAMLTILGFEEEINFWMNIERDMEVGRETDAEVQSRRGRIRIELGLIAEGNPEVIEDKIGRVGRNGVLIYDKLGVRSSVYQTAESSSVKLIQIRNGNPLLDIYHHLNPLVEIELVKPPEEIEEIKGLVYGLPSEMFQISKEE